MTAMNIGSVPHQRSVVLVGLGWFCPEGALYQFCPHQSFLWTGSTVYFYSLRQLVMAQLELGKVSASTNNNIHDLLP